MKHLTDEQLDLWLDQWARWCSNGSSIAALGYPKQSIDQSFVQSNHSSQTKILNHDIESLIESTVSALAQRDIKVANVGRFEYGASSKSHNPNYDKPSQKKNAAQLNMSLTTYKRKLADFRLAVWASLASYSVERKGNNAA